MNRLPSGEKGSIFVWTALTLAILIGFAAFATDIPYVYVARHQAQTAADAGALSGAYGLLGGPGQAVADAKVIAGKTPIIGQLLTAGQIDVFTCNSNGGAIGECLANSANPDQVTCITHRDVAHGNPMPLFLMPILQLFGLGRATANSSGWDAANVSATATAAIFNTCSGNCFKPWVVVDRWFDISNPPGGTPGQFDPGIDQYGAMSTGYQFPRDNGTQITLHVNPPPGTPPPNVTAGLTFAVDFPPLTRGTPLTGQPGYFINIATCGPASFMSVNDTVLWEPGVMTSARNIVQQLIDQDPGARWDGNCNCIVNSQFGATSPRLVPIAFFDPNRPIQAARDPITVIKVGGFFIENLLGGPGVNMTGRLSQVTVQGGTRNPSCAGLQVVQLVK